MPTKKQIIIVGVLCVITLGLGYWAGQRGSTNIVTAQPSVKAEFNPIIEKEIRRILKKSTGKLTKADLEKVTELYIRHTQLTEVSKGLEKLTQLKGLNLEDTQLTDVKGLEKLTQLRYLELQNNPDLTKAQIDQLQRALPKCKIWSNPKK